MRFVENVEILKMRLIGNNLITSEESEKVLCNLEEWLEDRKKNLGMKITNPTDTDINFPNGPKSMKKNIEFNVIVGILNWIADEAKKVANED